MLDVSLFKQFKLISKGIEGKGYVEWRKTVKKELQDVKDDNLINLHKRYELMEKRIQKSGRKAKMSRSIADAIGVMAPFLVLLFSIFLSMIGWLNSVSLEVANYQQNPAEIFNFIIQNVQPIFNMLLRASVVILIILLVCYFASYFLEELVDNKIIVRELYYGEIIKIVEEEMKDREMSFTAARTEK